MQSVLDKLCDLFAYSELVAKMDNIDYADLKAILQGNVEDTCKWVSQKFLSTKILYEAALEGKYAILN